MNRGTVDSFLADGCGRCELYRTADCKVHRFPEVLRALRELLRGTELTETMAWGSPCYALDAAKVVMLVARKNSAGLAFFKGSLLEDKHGMLVAPGPNSQASRELRFTSVDQVEGRRAEIVDCLHQAIAIERAGLKVAFQKEPEPVPEELQEALDADPSLSEAWDRLTRGRQRSHILHVRGARKSATRHNRAAKCAVKILAGRGWHERVEGSG